MCKFNYRVFNIVLVSHLFQREGEINTEKIMESSIDLERSLRKYWGYSTFRNQQRELCCAVLDGKDVFTSMATGSGKSLIYQLPAVACRDIGIPATIIVVSPLISLMNDQVQFFCIFILQIA